MIRQVLSWIIFFIAVIFFLYMLKVLAAAQQCGPAVDVMDVMEAYGESPIFEAEGTNGVVLEFFVNHLSKTWSVVTNNPEGLSCLIGSGTGFVELTRGNL